jgi:hypothetical protein
MKAPAGREYPHQAHRASVPVVIIIGATKAPFVGSERVSIPVEPEEFMDETPTLPLSRHIPLTFEEKLP